MSENHRSRSGPFLGIGALFAAVVCCALPLLVAGGLLGAIGGFFSNPAVLVLGVVLLAAALARGMRRRSRP